MTYILDFRFIFIFPGRYFEFIRRIFIRIYYYIFVYFIISCFFRRILLQNFLYFVRSFIEKYNDLSSISFFFSLLTFIN